MEDDALRWYDAARRGASIMKLRLEQGHTAGVCDAPDQRMLYEINGESEIFRGIEGAVCSII